MLGGRKTCHKIQFQRGFDREMLQIPAQEQWISKGTSPAAGQGFFPKARLSHVCKMISDIFN